MSQRCTGKQITNKKASMASTLPTVVMTAGACLSIPNDEFLNCALQPSDCDLPTAGSTRFVSPLWLARNKPIQADLCSRQSTIRSIFTLGRCSSADENFLCTSHASACRRMLNFAHVADCDLEHDYSNLNDFALPFFGYCAHRNNPARDWCAWQRSECVAYDDNALFSFARPDPVNARSGTTTACRCRDVHVGACVATTTDIGARKPVYYCAVTEASCETEPNFVYLPVLQFQDQFQISCRLCDSTTTVNPRPPPTTPDVLPAPPPISSIPVNPAPSPLPPLLLPNPSFDSSSDSGDDHRGSHRLSMGTKVGIIVSATLGMGTILTMLFVMLVVVKHRKKRTTLQRSSSVAGQEHDQQQEEENQQIQIEEQISTAESQQQQQQPPRLEESTDFSLQLVDARIT